MARVVYAPPAVTRCNIELGHCPEPPVFHVRSVIRAGNGHLRGFTDPCCALHVQNVIARMATGDPTYTAIVPAPKEA